jgi:putative serine protease PepD
MQLQTITPELAQATGASPGLFVETVTAGGPAAAAGLRPGDIIVEVDGEPVQNVDSLVLKTLTMRAGDVVRLKYHRQGVSNTTRLTLSAG